MKNTDKILNYLVQKISFYLSENEDFIKSSTDNTMTSVTKMSYNLSDEEVFDIENRILKAYRKEFINNKKCLDISINVCKSVLRDFKERRISGLN